MKNVNDQICDLHFDLQRNLIVLNYEEDGLVRLSLFGFVSIDLFLFNIKFDLNDKIKPRGQVSFEFVDSI